MKTIWKYELQITDHQTISVRDKNAKPLCVSEQNGKPCIWVELYDSYSDDAVIHIDIFGTGHHVHGTGKYVGTIHAENGLVWHIYAEVVI